MIGVLTHIGSKAAMTDGGTLTPHSLIKRKKEEYVWIGMTPGMMGTVIPAIQ
jgi:hypothetical protein